MNADAKTVTMTFVVYYDEPRVEGWLQERVHMITDKHPSRVIVLNGCKPVVRQEPSEDEPISDWTDLGVNGMSAADLDASITRLAVSDAPLVIAWLAPLSGDDRFARLAQRSATTWIVSTSALWTDDSAIRDLCAFHKNSPHVAVQDIAYLRLGTWQEIIAEFFDDGDMLEELFAIRHIEIVAGSDAEALYLIGWLAGRLQWKPCREDQFCNFNGDTIDFTISRGGPPRRICSVTLQSDTTQFVAKVHGEDDSAIACSITGKHERASRNMPLVQVDIASLVERAILTNGHDPVFTQALEATELLLEIRHPS